MMRKAWSIVRTVALLAIALGAISFALALVMDADLVRIADTVFSNYDLAKVIVAVEDAWHSVLGVFGL
ncbi:MAG TPA: hypothetical protein IAD43_00795 [Candidatus Scatomorpha pullicola]|nr:hypothetical protein [Candidatus Scatomorpha pullicola]